MRFALALSALLAASPAWAHYIYPANAITARQRLAAKCQSVTWEGKAAWSCAEKAPGVAYIAYTE